MRDVTAQFRLSETDHDELLKLLDVRFNSAWRVKEPGRGPSTEIDIPATKAFALRVRYRNGRIEQIFAGPALAKKKDLEGLLAEVDTILRGPSSKEFGRGVLMASRPVRGGFTSPSASLQILPAPDETARPNNLNAQHPFVLEFPIRFCQLPQLRLWRRYKNLAEWAWVLSVVLNGTIGFEGPRPRHMWMRFPDETSKYAFASEAYPPAVSEGLAPTLSQAAPALPVVPAATYYADWRNPVRASMPLDEFVVPDDLDRSLDTVVKLNADERARFLSAASIIHTASNLWDTSISSSFLASVQAIECVAQELPKSRRVVFWRRAIGPSRRFRQICELHGAEAGVDVRVLKRLYTVRSGLSHGEYQFDIDRHPWGIGIVGSVLGVGDIDAVDAAVRLAKCVLRSWLFSRRL